MTHEGRNSASFDPEHSETCFGQTWQHARSMRKFRRRLTELNKHTRSFCHAKIKIITDDGNREFLLRDSEWINNYLAAAVRGRKIRRLEIFARVPRELSSSSRGFCAWNRFATNLCLLGLQSISAERVESMLSEMLEHASRTWHQILKTASFRFLSELDGYVIRSAEWSDLDTVMLLTPLINRSGSVKVRWMWPSDVCYE